MTAPVLQGAVGGGHDLEQAMRAFAGVAGELVSSYQALERRAARVEQELERKVLELDAVTRDLEAILAALPCGVVVRDARGAIVRANPAAASILELTPLELEGPRGDELTARLVEGQAIEIEIASGARRTVVSRTSTLTCASGATRRVQILDDRTEFVGLVERLHTLDKLAALGNMASGIAHELRNPMNAIAGFAALLQRRAGLDSKECAWSASIGEAVRDADAILSSMLMLAKHEPLQRGTVQGDELARDAIAQAQVGRATPERWSITARSSTPPFLGDHLKLRQALRNLLANACEAQPDGGAAHVAIEFAGGEVELRVEDAGPGIPAALARRVLEPFFTTRAEGTGLGLALVNTIAQLHGGRLEVSPRASPMGGASLSIRIPFLTPSQS